MRKQILLSASFCAMVFFSANPARAQSVLWVSATGLNSNACSQTAPCATFQGAINKGNVAQIKCLTSGSYGPVTITASITIDCGAGSIGNVANLTNNGITINTTSAATIVLRHLSLNGFGATADGISARNFSSGTLIVEDCMIHGFQNGSGVYFAPSGGRGLLQVSNTQIFDNMEGIQVVPGSGQIASATLDHVELVANGGAGLFLDGSGVVAGTMRDSVVGQNGNTGVGTSGLGQVFFTIEESSIIANLSNGIATAASAHVVNVGSSTIGANGSGVTVFAGSIISFGNNQMSANGSNGNFTSTIALR
jgi:hypothetical protein